MSGTVPSSNDRLRTLDERLIVSPGDYASLLAIYAADKGITEEEADEEARRFFRTPVQPAPPLRVDTSDWPRP